jgi:hypothetical protein
MTPLNPWMERPDLLRSANVIERSLGVPASRVYHLVRCPSLPINREGGFLVAWRSKLREWHDGGGGDG